MSGIAGVLGLGRSGQAAARRLLQEGWEIRGLDQASASELALPDDLAGSIDLRAGGHAGRDLDGVSLLCVSPGVDWQAPLVVEARRRGVRVTSELELFLERCETPAIAVTGTNGKTTTACWVDHLLREAGRRTVLAGNVGVAALELLDDARSAEWVVLEVSSYQLEALSRVPFRAGALLNITPDHLVRHGTVERYAQIKRRIVTEAPAGAAVVVNADDALVMNGLQSEARLRPFTLGTPPQRGAGLEGDWIQLHSSAGLTSVLPAGALQPPGRHNVQNALAAALLADEAGLSPAEISAGLSTFSGVEHRIELVGEIEGVAYYNDSKATNPESTLSALSALVGRPIVLIAGGRSKGTGFGDVARAAARACEAAVLIGEAAEELEQALRLAGLARVGRAEDMDSAVRRGRELSRPGGVVLLSPACASFDMFADFEDRGRAFKRAVALLRDGVLGATG